MTQKLFTPDFILLILGQLTSLFGNFILKLALSMYVLNLTGSAAVFAGILSLATIPTILLSPFGGMQIAISMFSIAAVSLIQQKTPNHLIGKVMAYTSAITLCVQPPGQIVYGFLFDRFRDVVSLVLIPTGIIVCAIGITARKLNTQSL